MEKRLERVPSIVRISTLSGELEVLIRNNVGGNLAELSQDIEQATLALIVESPVLREIFGSITLEINRGTLDREFLVVPDESSGKGR